MCDIRTLELTLAIQRVINDARQSSDPARRTMARSVSALKRRDYEIQRDGLRRTLDPVERLELESNWRHWYDGVTWLIEHDPRYRKEPIQ